MADEHRPYAIEMLRRTHSKPDPAVGLDRIDDRADAVDTAH